MSIEPRPAQFTRQSAERIARVVRQSELRPSPGEALEFSAATSPPRTIRMAVFSGQWDAGTEKVVEILGTTSTLSAINFFAGMNPIDTCTVSIVRSGTAWHVVQPDMTQQQGYSGSGTQVLTIQNGVLVWVGTTVCA